MSIRNLEAMFSPRSVVFVGASTHQGSVGKTVTDNLLGAGFTGDIWLVNPHMSDISGFRCYPDIASLPGIPDLAVIATPPATIPELIRQLGEKGTRAVTIITAGVAEQDMLNAARPFCLRIIGPNCFGLMLPFCGLNASFAHLNPPSGNLGFISQSGAIISTTIDWAGGSNIGFSHIVSLGNMADVDVGDVLNYLAAEEKCEAILMYLEQVTNAQKFMAAARAAAIKKPVIVIKSGRHAEGAKAATSHTGALAGADDVYDAAFRQSGLLRVRDTADMFSAAEIFSRGLNYTGNRLSILTNGGGAGVLSVDRLIDLGGKPATLSDTTLTALSAVLPASWSKANPVDIIGDADPARYSAALEQLLIDANSDAVLVIHCPTALAPSLETAQACADLVLKSPSKPVLTAWLGGIGAEKGREVFSHGAIPAFATPEDAVRGFSYLSAYHDIRKNLLTQETALPRKPHDTTSIRKIIDQTRQEKRAILTESEAKDILAVYDIPTVPTVVAVTPDDVFTISEKILKDYKKIVLKIHSKKITHKSDVGGVVLNLTSPDLAQNTAQDMFVRLGKDIDGFTVQPMIERPQAYELILGISHDHTFGPVILCGAGGTAAELIADRSLCLPPLTEKSALEAVMRTKLSRLLQGYRHVAAVDFTAVTRVLMALSAITEDFPEIMELDINPLLIDNTGAIALDARIVIKIA